MSEAITQTFLLPEGTVPVLRGTSRWVSVDVTARPGIRQIECEATSNFLSLGDLDDLIRFWQQDGTVFFEVAPMTLRMRFGQNVRISVVVPEGTEVAIQANSGSVRMEGSYGPVTAQVSSGSLRLDRALTLSAEAHSGSVRAGGCGPTRVHVSSGSVTIESVAGGFDFEASSGSVRLGSLRGEGEIRTNSGSIKVGTFGGVLRATAGSGSIELAQLTEGAFFGDTRSGSQKIGVAQGTAVLVDAHASSGNVRSNLEGADPGQYERTAEIHAQARSGSIRIYRS